ncbi:unnamed protein product, partial [Darwinula stevensoni]
RPSRRASFRFSLQLRDNCKCGSCLHPETRQKLLDTGSLDVNIRPSAMQVNEEGRLEVLWPDGHRSVFDASWLYRYGQSFMHDTFEGQLDVETGGLRPPVETWDRTRIWKHFPEIAYEEFQSSEEGLKRWLELVYKYGFAVIRGVPTEKEKVVEVVHRFAYVKETSYGVTFDVVSEPEPDHLAFTGRYLEHHTDMNYREKSPGLQLLHCIQAKSSGADESMGKSFFVDGFYVAQWLEEHEPTAFHILSSTPIRFQIKSGGKRYSNLWPVILLDNQGNVSEIHYNNRTMGPLQAPGHIIIPFYHALKLFVSKLRDQQTELVFQMLPGDLVAFNNRRVLHGRTSFDPTKVTRHLVGCYVDIDEAFSVYDSLLAKGV